MVEHGQALAEAMARTPDPTPEPGGIRGIFHDVGDVATTAGRATLGALGDVSGAAARTVPGPGRAVARFGLAALEDLAGAAQTELSRARALSYRAEDAVINRLPGPVSVGKIPGFGTPYGYTEPSRGANFDQFLTWQIIRGKGAGSGFRPGGEARHAAIEAQRAERGTIDGHAATVGRLAAAQVFDPEDVGYTIMSGAVDLGVAIWADPTAIGLKAVGDVRRARQLFTPDALAENGWRRWVQGPGVDRFLASHPGQRFVQRMVETNKTRDVWRMFNRNIPIRVAYRFAAAGSPEAVGVILRDAVTTGGIRTVPALQHGYAWRRPLQQNRWLAQLPHGHIEIDDLDNAARQLERVGVAARLDRDRIDTAVALVPLAKTPEDLLTISKDFVTRAIRERMVADGVGADHAQEATRLFYRQWDEARRTMVDELGNGARVPGPVVDGVQMPDVAIGDAAFSLAEGLNGAVPLPDMRKIAALTWRYKEVGRIPGFRPGNTPLGRAATGLNYAMNTFTDVIWKPSVLITRLGWPIRVIGEEQVRMAASGLDSTFHHPLRWVAWVVGRRGNIDPATWRAPAPVMGRPVIDGDLVTIPDLHVAGRVKRTDAAAGTVTVRYRTAEGVLETDTFPLTDVARREAAQQSAEVATHGLESRVVAASRSRSENEWQTWKEVAEDLRYNTEWAAAQSRAGRFSPNDPTEVYAQDWVTYDRGAGGYTRAWADDLTSAALDPVQRTVARMMLDPTYRPTRAAAAAEGAAGTPGTAVDAVKAWFFDGAGKKYRVRIAGRRTVLYTTGTPVDLTTRAGSDWYIDATALKVQHFTGNDTALIDAVAHGTFGRWNDRTQAFQISTTFLNRLRKYADEGIGPAKVVGRKRLTTRVRPGRAADAGNIYDRALNAMFYQLMGRPSNYLSRSPAFRQYYWQRVSEVLPYATPKARARFLGAATDSHLAHNDMVALRRAAAGPAGHASFTTLDTIAKGYGLDSTRQLLYDVSEKGQFFAAANVVFPFGEAWKEIMTRWMKIIPEHPQAVERGRQLVEGSSGPTFVRKDPADGKQYMVWPLSQQILSATAGVPFTFAGSLQGLNIATSQAGPGVGPVVQIALSRMIPKTPSWAQIREYVYPYGEPDTGSGFFEMLFPGSVQRLRTAGLLKPLFGPSPDQVRMFDNSAYQIFAYHASTGKFDLNDADSLQALQDRSVREARWLYAVRALATAAAPVAPRVDPTVEGPDGKLLDLYAVTAKYREWMDKNPDTAAQKFLRVFGTDLRYLMQSQAYRRMYGAGSAEAMQFANAHPAFARDYDAVYGFFVEPSVDYDPEAYKAALERGEVAPLDLTAKIHLANARVAGVVYDRWVRKAGPSPSFEQEQWLRDLKEWLADEFPGYDTDRWAPSRADQADYLRQLAGAVEDPLVADLPVTGAIRDYMAYRDQALRVAHDNELAGLSSARLEPQRAWLRAYGARLVKQVPEFKQVWDWVFFPEVEPGREVKESAA